ncbi:MAG: tail fiber domain-containing protein [Chitinophagales bacterium]
MAQAPQAFNYQAVLRSDSVEILSNDTVDLHFTILSNGNIEFEETHSGVISNAFGLINLKIGTIDTLGFSAIDWSRGSKELQVEVDAGNGFENLGNNELLSVPYAMYASGPWKSDTANVFYTEGRVGVGTDTPQTKLHLKYSEGFAAGGGLTIDHEFSTSDWQIYGFSDVGNSRLALINGGVERGNFNATTGAYSATSDRNLKANIQPMSSVLNKVLHLNPKTYNYKEDENQKLHIGFIAQDVERYFPEIVSKDYTDENQSEFIYHMNYSGFGVLAIKAIQEQQEVIGQQQKAIDLLQDELDALKAEFENLKNK